MATFKEVAEYILSLPEIEQQCEACFINLDDDRDVTIDGANIRMARIIEDDFAPAIFGAPVMYKAIVCSNEEVDDEYKHFDI